MAEMEMEQVIVGKKNLKQLFLKKPLTTIGKDSKPFQWIVLGVGIFALCLALAYCFVELYS